MIIKEEKQTINNHIIGKYREYTNKLF